MWFIGNYCAANRVSAWRANFWLVRIPSGIDCSWSGRDLSVRVHPPPFETGDRAHTTMTTTTTGMTSGCGDDGGGISDCRSGTG